MEQLVATANFLQKYRLVGIVKETGIIPAYRLTAPEDKAT
jgi:hypothetical protein